MKTAIVLLMALTVLLAVSAVAVQAAGFQFTPQAGFGGASEGNGTLQLFFGAQRPYHVESYGKPLADGMFRLDQTVLFRGKPPARRHWILTTVRPGTYIGTLSDASGRVTGHAEGSRLLLRYRLAGPLVMHQTLEFMPDGTIDNVGRITLLGIPVGHLRETIMKGR
ncbi:MAG: DUF3833 family protein [Rhodanobacter sp.]